LLSNRSIFSFEAIDRDAVLSLATIVIVLVVVAAAYMPGLSGPLLLDDLPQLQRMIDNSADDPKVLFNNHIISISGPFGRPVAMATFIGSAIAHGPDIWWWKYDNVMYHLITGLLIFWLTALLLAVTADPNQKRHWLIAAALASFWLLHPLHVSTVLYTVQRMTELSSLFVVAGLIFYVKGRQRQVSLGRNGWHLIILAFGVFFPTAVWCKESGLLFPVFCSLIEIIIFRYRGNSVTQKQVKVFHGALVFGYVLLVLYVIVNFSSVILAAYEIREFTLLERVYTELRVVVLYLSQILLPVQGNMGFFHDDFTLSTSLFNPITTFFSGLLLIALFASAILLRKRLPLYAFGILFFFVGHVLESTIFGLELVFEHRNYLPSLGILIAAFTIIQELVKQRQALIWVAVIGLGGLSLLTWQRADTWGSPIKLYEFMRYAHPRSPRLNLLYVNIFAKMENFEEARKLLARMPGGPGPKISKLYLDCIENREVAGSDILDVLETPGGVLNGHVGSSIQALTQAMLDGKCIIPKYELLTLIDHLLPLPARALSDRQMLFFIQARILESMGKIDAALGALQAAHELQPGDAKPLYFSAHSLSTVGRLDEAAKFLTAAYELEKTSRIQYKDIAATIYLNIGRTYLMQEELEKSLTIFSEGSLSVPKEPQILMHKIELLIRLQRYASGQEIILELSTLDEIDRIEHQYTIRRLEATLQERSETPIPISQ